MMWDDRFLYLAAGISGPGGAFTPVLNTTQSMYAITALGPEGSVVHLRHDGRVWTTEV